MRLNALDLFLHLREETLQDTLRVRKALRLLEFF
jgi:hypothetical protein